MKMPWDLRYEKGPFDIIGDVHGCADELEDILTKLGYKVGFDGEYQLYNCNNRRKAIFVGDLVDRGPDTPRVLEIVMSMVNRGIGYCVIGNHDDKLMRKLRGNNVVISDGLNLSLEQLGDDWHFKQRTVRFLDSLSPYYVFDEGKLAVAHAWIDPKHFGNESNTIRECCMYGLQTNETDESGIPVRHVKAKDEFGYPLRYDWAKDYTGDTFIAYGHIVVPEAKIINNTIDVDTGCVFGGKLTAFRYPEMEIVDVQAKKVYYGG